MSKNKGLRESGKCIAYSERKIFVSVLLDCKQHAKRHEQPKHGISQLETI
jgi:hypothetical protein